MIFKTNYENILEDFLSNINTIKKQDADIIILGIITNGSVSLKKSNSGYITQIMKQYGYKKTRYNRIYFYKKTID